MEAALARPLAAVRAAGSAISDALTSQTDLLARIVGLAGSIVSSRSRSRAALGPLGGAMGDLSEAEESTSPVHILHHHIAALAAAASAFAWVADPAPLQAVRRAEAAAKAPLAALSRKEAPHRDLADAVDSFLDALAAFVKKHHQAPLEFAEGDGDAEEVVPAPVAAAPRAAAVAGRNGGGAAAPTNLRPRQAPAVPMEGVTGGNDYVSKFNELIAGSVATYIAASHKIGAEVAEQAFALQEAFQAESQFLSKAIAMPKPADIQSMITPIATEMGKVAAVTEKMGPRETLTNHCTAISESVSALGWVTVDEKAVGFVGDMAGAGQFYLDKVKMAAKKTDDPAMHREWTKSVEAMFADLKAYVKEYHTQKLVWNPPKRVQARGAAVPVVMADDGEGGDDYVSVFETFITETVTPYVTLSKKIGGPVGEQANAFLAAFRAEAGLLKKAISTPKPADIQGLLAPIAAEMGNVGSIAEKLNPREALANHCTAISESVSALGWVAVDEKATPFVSDMAGAGQFYLDKVKMGAKKMDDPTMHRDWTKSVEAIFAGLKAYVKEYHTQKLTWNPPKRAQRRSAVAASTNGDDEGGSGDYVTKFEEYITEYVLPYENASKKIGGQVAEQSDAFVAAFRAEAAFLKKAITTPKPSDVQSMLTPIANEMGKVAAVTEKMGPREELTNHCMAISESVSALGWVAVDEKATGFVGDMAGAGQFYLDKVKMGAKKTNDPTMHREWTKSVEAVFAGLKAYVKEYHTQHVVWNPQQAAKRSARPTAAASSRTSGGGDYVSQFRELITGPVAAYVSASNTLGGEVAQQAKAFAAAWEAEAQMLSKAIGMQKPADIQALIAPIAAEMGNVAAVSEKLNPRDELANHCTAIAESVSALGWVAVDEKATPFVSDMAGAGQFYLDKVKMGARKAANADAQKAWAGAVEAMFVELKAYVKEHHTQKLTWKR